jgi:hypothetical protein
MSLLNTNCIQKSSSLKIRVYVHLDLRVIAWAGVFPTVTTDLTIQCPPLQGSLLSTLFEANKPGLGQTLSSLGATLKGKTDNGAIQTLASTLPGSPTPDQLGATVNDALGSELKNLLNGKN